MRTHFISEHFDTGQDITACGRNAKYIQDGYYHAWDCANDEIVQAIKLTFDLSKVSCLTCIRSLIDKK